MSTATGTINVRSIAFAHGGHIPARFTCEGDNISPALEIGDLPENAKSVALIMEDPDAPRGTFTHWLLWNIRPGEAISENNNAGTSGTNSFGKRGYGGPCPPSGVHRYFFKVYALDVELQIDPGSGKQALNEAMQGHIIAEGALMGLYQKRK